MTRPTWDAEFESGVIGAEKKLRAFAVRLCGRGDAADDLVQGTILRAFEKHDRYERGTNLHGWLFTILRNDWLTQCRKNKRWVHDPDGVFAAQLAIGEGQSAAYDLKVILKRMRMLNSLQRQAIEIVAINGYQYDEAAEMLGVPTGTVKSSLSRARIFLETGDEASLLEPAEAPAHASVSTRVEATVRSLYSRGASVSNIAAQVGIGRTDVMQLVVDRKLRRH